jgi:hypothetical protein
MKSRIISDRHDQLSSQERQKGLQLVGIYKIWILQPYLSQIVRVCEEFRGLCPWRLNKPILLAHTVVSRPVNIVHIRLSPQLIRVTAFTDVLPCDDNGLDMLIVIHNLDFFFHTLSPFCIPFIWNNQS